MLRPFPFPSRLRQRHRRPLLLAFLLLLGRLRQDHPAQRARAQAPALGGRRVPPPDRLHLAPPPRRALVHHQSFSPLNSIQQKRHANTHEQSGHTHPLAAAAAAVAAAAAADLRRSPLFQIFARGISRSRVSPRSSTALTNGFGGGGCGESSGHLLPP